MHGTAIAGVSMGCIFTGALLGLGLQRLLPGHHLSKETQDVIRLSAGMIATLTALVLGLLVSSAKSTFDAVNNGIVQSSAKFQILSDLVVKPQVTDIICLILQLVGHPNGVHRPCRNRKSRGTVLSTSEGQWATTKSDGVWTSSRRGR